jgi:hypothetical protein
LISLVPYVLITIIRFIFSQNPRFYASSRLKSGLLIFNAACLGVISILLLGFGIFCLADSKDAQDLVKNQLHTIVDRFVNVCPRCCLKESKTVTPQNCPNGTRIQNSTTPRCCKKDVLTDRDFVTCCEAEAGLLVWNNLSVLGITCMIAYMAVLLNLAGSYVLFRRIKKDMLEDMKEGEMETLEDGVPHEEDGVPREDAASRAKKYRVDEPDDGL